MTDTRQYPQYFVKKIRGLSQPIDPFQKFHETELKSVGVRVESGCEKKASAKRESSTKGGQWSVYKTGGWNGAQP